MLFPFVEVEHKCIWKVTVEKSARSKIETKTKENNIRSKVLIIGSHYAKTCEITQEESRKIIIKELFVKTTPQRNDPLRIAPMGKFHHSHLVLLTLSNIGYIRHGLYRAKPSCSAQFKIVIIGLNCRIWIVLHGQPDFGLKSKKSFFLPFFFFWHFEWTSF